LFTLQKLLAATGAEDKTNEAYNMEKNKKKNGKTIKLRGRKTCEHVENIRKKNM